MRHIHIYYPSYVPAGTLRSFYPDAVHRGMYGKPGATKLTFGDLTATESLMKSFAAPGSIQPREPIYDAPSWIENNFQVQWRGGAWSCGDDVHTGRSTDTRRLADCIAGCSCCRCMFAQPGVHTPL